MNPIVYQLESFNENFKNLKSTRSGFNRFSLFIDYFCCMMKYGASAADYFEFGFYDKKASARKPFVCWKFKKAFMRKANDYSKAHLFNNKTEFLNTFSEFVGRDWLSVGSASYEEFLAFIEKHREFMVKAQNLSCGRGITKMQVDDNTELLYEELKRQDALLEEVIVQHPKMNNLYPNAVNSIRVAAVCVNERVEILGAVLRCGSGSGCIDNYCAGGWAMKIDPETGIVISDGCNVKQQRACKHPDTGIMFHGFVVPHWEKVRELVEKAFTVIPEVRYVGWDVAVRAEDVILIEGNFEGMFNIIQQPANLGIKQEVLRIYREL